MVFVRVFVCGDICPAPHMVCNYSSFVHLHTAAKFLSELQETTGWLLSLPVTG